MPDAISLPNLRALLGLHVRYLGEDCLIVEVLDEPPALILQPNTKARMMPDHFGRPFEYGVQTVTVRVLSDDRTGLHDDLLELEILD